MQIFLMLAAGLATGIMSGIFGIGGGVILVPLLVLLLGMPQLTANGTSLVALLLPVGFLGVVEYFKAGKITPDNIRYGLLISVGIFLGTYLGSQVALSLPVPTLRKAFSLLLAFLGLRLWFMR